MFETTPPSGVMNIEPFTPAGRMAPTFQLLSKREVQDYYQNIINNWKPLSDVWAIRIAPHFATVAIAASGFCVNYIFRQKLNMREIGLAMSIFCTSGMNSAVFNLYDRLSRRDFLESNYCPVCMHARHAVMYPTFGVVLPLIVAPAVNFHYAEKYGFQVPTIHELGKMRKICWTIVKPALPTIGLLVGALGILGVFMSNETMKSVHFVHFVMAQMHRDYLKNYDAALDKKRAIEEETEED